MHLDSCTGRGGTLWGTRGGAFYTCIGMPRELGQDLPGFMQLIPCVRRRRTTCWCGRCRMRSRNACWPCCTLARSPHLISCASRRRRTAWCGSRRRRSRTTCWACCTMLRVNWTAAKRSSTGGWSTGALRPGHRCGSKIIFFAAPAGAVGRQGMCAEQAQRGWRINCGLMYLLGPSWCMPWQCAQGSIHSTPRTQDTKTTRCRPLLACQLCRPPMRTQCSRPRTGWHRAGTRWWWTRWRGGSGRSAWLRRRGEG